MTEIIRGLLHFAFEGSVVVLAVFLIRIFLKTAPKKWIGMLWLVAIFRLLCPFAVEGPIPAFWEERQELARPIVHTTGLDTALEEINWTKTQGTNDGKPTDGISSVRNQADKQQDTGLMEIQPNEGTVVSDTLEQKEFTTSAQESKSDVFKPQIWLFLVALFWGAGSICCLLLAVRNYVGIFRTLQNARKVSEFDGVEVRESDMTGLPASFGFFRSAIYVPAGFLECGDDKEYILWHERMHIKHLDSMKKVLMYLVLCIHWWNPLVWLMVRVMNDDLEMACDEAVLAKLGEEKKAEYANIIVRFSMKQSGLEIPVFFGKSNTENRVKNVLMYHKLPVFTGILLFVLVVGFGICLATRPHSTEKWEQETIEKENNPIVSENGTTIFLSRESIDSTYRGKWVEKLLKEGRITDESQLIGVMHNKSNSEENPEIEYWHGDFSILTDDYRIETYRTELTLEHTENQYTLKEEREYLLPVIQTSEIAVEYGIKNFYCHSEEKYGIEYLAEMLKENSPESYKKLLKPDTAAQFLMNLEGGEAEYLLQDIYTALVTYTFQGGDSVHYLMLSRPGCEVWDTGVLLEQYPDWYEGYEASLLSLKEKLDGATAELLRRDSNSGFETLASIQGEDIALYGTGDTDGTSKRGMVLRVLDDVYPIYLDWDNMHHVNPELYKGDFDQDGEMEYAITTVSKTGTGTLGYSLYILEIENGKVEILEFAERDWQKQLQANIQYQYNEDYNSLRIFDENGVFMTSYTLKEDSFRELVLGDIQSFECRDGIWYFRTNGGVISKEIAHPQYESEIEFISPVSYQDGVFLLEKITPNRKELPLHIDEEPGIQQKTVQTVTTDLTHDGTPDVIFLDIEQYAEDAALSSQQLLDKGYMMYLRVICGETVLSSNEPDDGCIFERFLATAHEGNGIYYLVHDNGKDYLMEISCAMYQGSGDFFYKVFLLGNDGTKYVVEEKHQGLDVNDPDKVQPVEEMVAFTRNLQEWLDKGELLALIDVNLGVRIYGEEDAKLDAWEIWDDILEEIPELIQYAE